MPGGSKMAITSQDVPQAPRRPLRRLRALGTRLGLANPVTLKLLRVAERRAFRARLARDPDSLPRRINIGCGFDKRPGFLNIDSDATCRPDLLIAGNDLSILPRRWFEHAVSKDVLEHIPHAQTMPALVAWNWLLKPGGTLYLETSEIYGTVARMREKTSFENEFNWRICLFGSQVHPSDYHLNGFTDTTLRVYLTAAGYEVDGFDMTEGWLISTTATKRQDWLELLDIPGDREFIAECYRQLLSRDPGPDEPAASGLYCSREVFLRDVISAPERLYATAERLGL